MPSEVERADVEMPVVWVVVHAGFGRDGDGIGREIAAQKGPVDAGEIFGGLRRCLGGDGARGPEQVKNAALGAPEGFGVPSSLRVAAFLDHFIDDVGLPDGIAGAITEATGKTKEGEVYGMWVKAAVLEEIHLAAARAFEGVNQAQALPNAVGPIAAAFLPCTVGADLFEHVPDAFIGAGNDVGELRIFAEEGEGGETEAGVTDAGPVAFVSGGPPEILVVAADARDGFFQERAADAIALGLGESGMEPVVDVGQALARGAGGDVVGENHLVVFGAVRPDTRINHIEGMRGLNPRFLSADNICMFKRFADVRRVAGHLVEKRQREGRVEMFSHIAAIIVGPDVARVNDPRRGLALGGGVEQATAFEQESRKGLGGFRIIFNPCEHRRFFLGAENEIRMLAGMLCEQSGERFEIRSLGVQQRYGGEHEGETETKSVHGWGGLVGLTRACRRRCDPTRRNRNKNPRCVGAGRVR